MVGKKRLLSLMVVMTAISMTVVVVSLTLLYESAFEQQRVRLIDTVKSQATLLTAIARYSQYVAPDLLDENPEYDAFEATLSLMREAHDIYGGIGQTGEFTLARHERDQIVFLLNRRHHDFDELQPIVFSSANAEPMRRALNGISGAIVGLDYRGEQVLSAYEPVPELGLGIVAKIDLSEIRAPFIRAGLISVGIAIALTLIGAMLFFRIGNPMVRDLIAKESQLRDITTTIPGSVYQFILHQDGSISFPYMSEAFEKLTGIKSSILTENANMLFDYVPHGDHASFKDSIRRSAETMTPWDHEFRITTPDKGTIWLHGRSNPCSLPEGSILWNGVLTDVTERKQAEVKIEQLAAFAKNNPAPVFKDRFRG